MSLTGGEVSTQLKTISAVWRSMSYPKYEREELSKNKENLKKEIEELRRKFEEDDPFFRDPDKHILDLDNEFKFFQRVIDDLISNFSEQLELERSLWEICSLLESLKEGLSQINQRKSQTKIKSEENAIKLDIDNNIKVKEKLDKALNINSKQKLVLKNLLLNLFKNLKKNIYGTEVSRKQAQIETISNFLVL